MSTTQTPQDEIHHITEYMAVLIVRFDEIIIQMDTMPRDLKAIDNHVGNLTGSRLERRVARTTRGRLRHAIGFSLPRILHRDWSETDNTSDVSAAIVIGCTIPDAERARAAHAGATPITVPAPED